MKEEMSAVSDNQHDLEAQASGSLDIKRQRMLGDRAETTVQATRDFLKKTQQSNQSLQAILHRRQAAAAQQVAQAKKKEQDKKEEEEEDADADAALAKMGQFDDMTAEETKLEPQADDETVLEPQAQEFSLNAPETSYPSLQLAQPSPDQVFNRLLEQRLVVALQGSSGPVLQLLFRAVVRRASDHAVQELMQHYGNLGRNCPGTRPSWSPSLDDLCAALKQLGYVSRIRTQEPKGRGAKAPAGPATTSQGDSDAPMTDAAGPSSGSGGSGGCQSESRRQHAAACLQQVLRLITGLCELQTTLDVLDFSRASKGAGQSLLLALLELHLSPHVRRVALVELSGATEALVGAWAQADSATWKNAVEQVSKLMPLFGPSYKGALVVLKDLTCFTPPMMRLQQACLLALHHHLLDCGGTDKQDVHAHHSDPVDQAMRALKSKAPRPADLVKKLRLTHAAGADKVDFHRIMALLECTFTLIWAAVYEPDATEHHKSLASDFKHTYLDDFQRAVRGMCGAAVAKMKANNTEMANQLEFTAPGLWPAQL